MRPHGHTALQEGQRAPGAWQASACLAALVLAATTVLQLGPMLRTMGPPLQQERGNHDNPLAGWVVPADDSMTGSGHWLRQLEEQLEGGAGEGKAAAAPLPWALSSHHSRLVVLPDIHGDLQQALAALALARCVDSTGRWSGGDTLLVQLGDVVDRGHHSLELLDFFEQLAEQAAQSGGAVRLLLGNHELMNILQDYRYISRSELRALAALGHAPHWHAPAQGANARSTQGQQQQQAVAAGQGDLPGHELRQLQSLGDMRPHGKVLEHALPLVRQALPGRQGPQSTALGAAAAAPVEGEGVQRLIGGMQRVSSRALRGGAAGLQLPRRALLDSTRDTLAQGLQVWARELHPNARLGSLIRARPLALRANVSGCSALLVHAGAFPWMLEAAEKLVASAGGTVSMPLPRPSQYVDVWNAALGRYLGPCHGRGCGTPGDAGSELADALLGSHGAVWSRHYLKAHAQQVCEEARRVARALQVQRIVVGHTVQPGGRVASKCDGLLLMADVGISREIAGALAALECIGGRWAALYPEGPLPL